MSESKAIEYRIRRHLKRIGCELHKDRARIRSKSRQGGYSVSSADGLTLIGSGFTSTLDEIETWMLNANSNERNLFNA